MPKVVELKKKNNKTFEMYPNFNETEREDLRVWNRCAIYFNIIRDLGLEEAKKYVRQFNVTDRAKMLTVYNLIKEKGIEPVKAMVMKGDLVFI